MVIKLWKKKLNQIFARAKSTSKLEKGQFVKSGNLYIAETRLLVTQYYFQILLSTGSKRIVSSEHEIDVYKIYEGSM